MGRVRAVLLVIQSRTATVQPSGMLATMDSNSSSSLLLVLRGEGGQQETCGLERPCTTQGGSANLQQRLCRFPRLPRVSHFPVPSDGGGSEGSCRLPKEEARAAKGLFRFRGFFHDCRETHRKGIGTVPTAIVAPVWSHTAWTIFLVEP